MLMRHALKNAAVPIVTVIGIGVALLISGVVITETVFNIPGIGRLTVDAIAKRDYPIIQGVMILCSRRLRAGQPRRRHAPTPSSTRASGIEHVAEQAAIAAPAPVATRGTAAQAWRFARRNPTIVVGGAILAVHGPRHRCSRRCSPATRSPCCRATASGRPRPSTGSAPTISAATSSPAPSTARRSRCSSGCWWPASRSCSASRSGSPPATTARLDGPIMRVMDGVMAIPAILLAIALVSLSRASVGIVIIAIVIPEVPRVVRLVRSVVLTVREQPYRRGGDRRAAAGASRSCCATSCRARWRR